jgi:signal peptidase I
MRVTGNRGLRLLSSTTDLLLVATLVVALALLSGRVTGSERPGLPTWFGRSVLAVTSGSMSPTLGVGDAVVADVTIEPDEITTGDVVVYTSPVLPDMLITHRVVDTGIAADGRRVFTTSGDATSATDTATVTEEQLIGRMSTRLPFAGLAMAAATNVVVPVAFTVASVLARTALWTSRSTRSHTIGIRRRPGVSLDQKDNDT